jgi:hypothetical protein
MVPATGLEPIEASFLVFSLLLIFAFLCANLHALIQAFPSYCKQFVASLGKFEQKKLCGIVRLCGNCAEANLVRNLCGPHLPFAGRSKPLLGPIACHGDRFAWNVTVFMFPRSQTNNPPGNEGEYL